jgi:hypothetical protein
VSFFSLPENYDRRAVALKIIDKKVSKKYFVRAPWKVSCLRVSDLIFYFFFIYNFIYNQNLHSIS